MTTLMMPSDYGSEMLLGTSPVLGSSFLGGSPRANSLLADYSRITSLWTNQIPSGSSSSNLTINQNYYNTSSQPISIPDSSRPNFLSEDSIFDDIARPLVRKASKRCSKRNKKVLNICQPTKSCLVIRPLNTVELCGDVETPTSPTKEKKKVSFADTQGWELAVVKFITEPSDCPPRLSPGILEQVTGGAKPVPVGDTWNLTFPQPISDYMGWKTKLERENVALENVKINHSESTITGTIKVRNMSYHKIVSVRYTTSNWNSHDDVEATYIPALTSNTSSYTLYDNFSFTVHLPNSTLADKIEFCIKYSGENFEYWDNNNGKNYVAVCIKPNYDTSSKKPNDVYNVSIDSWSQFACWNHLTLNDTPYY